MLLQISSLLATLALTAEAATSHTSVSTPYGRSYSYGVDHDQYSAWYGHAPHSYAHLDKPLLGAGSLYASGDGIYGHSFNYYGGHHGSSHVHQSVKTEGGQKTVHSSYGIQHGPGASSSASLYMKTGDSGLYSSIGAGNYADHFSHHTYPEYHTPTLTHTYSAPVISSEVHHLNPHIHHEPYPHFTGHYANEALHNFNGEHLDEYNHGSYQQIPYSEGNFYSPMYGHSYGHYWPTFEHQAYY